jgi:hypothetical protein
MACMHSNMHGRELFWRTRLQLANIRDITTHVVRLATCGVAHVGGTCEDKDLQLVGGASPPTTISRSDIVSSLIVP